ncbi:hypothetical protein [Kribbella sp. CA-293567]|uniref:hypothetical protein n=1 Tax=Kribbella sp. CA-293567 TaxID=3002436 RepID=UPI0022DD4E6A|nr:hypothetical protein [Kribbella sp. CA-293567]WBQ03704.1 hypothetical protein OX958_27490 [Kribbella sp. CA-293567]
MRNYWALLPAIAICVGLILLYAVPTLVNPQWTSSVLGLFKQLPGGAQTEEPAALGPRQLRSRRMLAGVLVIGALALVGFNVSLNREANGCYLAAKAWGATDSPDKDADPCVDKIFGAFISSGKGVTTEKTQQPVPSYQLIRGNRPKYLNWVQNPPKHDEANLLFGLGFNCTIDLKVTEEETKITAVIDTTEPCPPDDQIELIPIKLKKPLGDRPVVTVGDQQINRIDPEMPSWGKVLKELATGG